MEMKKVWTWIGLAVVLGLAVLVSESRAAAQQQQEQQQQQQQPQQQQQQQPQQQDTSCLTELLPCFNYLSMASTNNNNNNNNKDPPHSCCDPLKSVIKFNPQCLCSMMTNIGSYVAGQAGIDVNKAQELPAKCGLYANPIACLAASNPSNKNTISNGTASGLYSYVNMMLAVALLTIVQVVYGSYQTVLF